MVASKKYVIVGAVAGGASCAARLRRLDEGASITIFEKGPDPSFANCGMPYHIGGEIPDRNKLNVQTPATLKAKLNLDVRVNTEVLSIDRVAHTVRVKDLASGKEYDAPYDHLVLSPGAKPFLPPIPGIDRAGNLPLRNLDDMDKISEWIRHAGCRTAVVAGGGFIGIEMAEQLKHKGMDVTIVEALPQLMAPFDQEMAHMLQRELEMNGVHVLVNKPIKAFETPKTNGALGSDVVLGEDLRIPADVVILGLGVRADSGLAAQAGLEMNNRGGIVVDSCMRTSDPSIWAVGDAIEVKNPVAGGEWMVALAGPANRQGRLCADNIAGKRQREYKGTYGSSAVRVFSLTAAGTGLNERGIQMTRKKCKVVHIHPNSHASYFPGAESIHLKLLFEVDSVDEGRILGAQAVARDGAEKAIDVIATAMQARMTVHDIAELELCYAPPVGSAKSPVNYAGMVAQDILEGLVDTVQWNELPQLVGDESVSILDVRSAKEIATNGALHPRAVNIPLNELRERLGEVPKDKMILTTCASGQRGYYAARVLMQHGFNVKNLDGAYKTFSVSPIAE